MIDLGPQTWFLFGVLCGQLLTMLIDSRRNPPPPPPKMNADTN